MLHFSRWKIAFFIALFAIPLLASSLLFKRREGSVMKSDKNNSTQNEAFPPAMNPYFVEFDPTKANISEVQKRQFAIHERFNAFGYAEDVPLSKAVNDFNEWVKHDFKEPLHSLLTEGEVLAAVTAEQSNIDIRHRSPSANSDFEKILRKKILPKGTKFHYKNDHRLPLSNELNASDIFIKCWEISLFRELDKNPIASEPLKVDQIFVIRKTYFGIE